MNLDEKNKVDAALLDKGSPYAHRKFVFDSADGQAPFALRMNFACGAAEAAGTRQNEAARLIKFLTPVLGRALQEQELCIDVKVLPPRRQSPIER